MEARLGRLLLILAAAGSVAATYPTANFVVHAPSPEVAQKVAIAAEKFRRELAVEWLGRELPQWSKKCPIKVRVGAIGAGGQTTFTFHPSSSGLPEVTGWDMQIQGSVERILDSVLPHEVSHTIFACHFRRPLPRWADEGAATLVEHESERRRQIMTVQQVIKTRRRIPLQTLLTIKEYPKDIQDVMTLYAEGYSLAELLVQSGGKAKYLKFLNDAHQHGWEKAIPMHYEFRGVEDLERRWHEWIIAGSPELKLPDGQQLADDGRRDRPTSGAQPIVRTQSPDAESARDSDPFLERSTQDRNASGDARRLAVDVPRPRARSRPGSAASAPGRAQPNPPRERASVGTGPHSADESTATVETAAIDPDAWTDGGVWMDLPCSQSHASRPRVETEAVPALSRSKQQRSRNAREAMPLPSVVRQRQSHPRRTADNRRSPRGNPWSEFPKDSRLPGLD